MRLAVVIPVLDDAAALERCLPEAMAVGDEVCVVDGGSRDGSIRLAEAAGASVVRSPAGRGHQLNRGAAATRCDVILFLHADTRLPAVAREAIEEAVAGGAVGGGFEMRFDDPRAIFSFGSRFVSLRTRWLHIPLGDQAQFLTRAAFEELGGFAEWPILEDLDLIRRLKRLGRIGIVRHPVVTSARRFSRQGVARTVARNWWIWLRYRLGARPETLAHLYPPPSGRRPATGAPGTVARKEEGPAPR
ncbi:MAG: TIGR04283 family arsenosugar biosynthesis glycosyltransferase [Thermoanaerobaculia bacterium]|nr:TIGR04283 family arsenosugar biosynthesis glycosyltransferase [Thermoanaerobaculia bacterium]